jgi:hypothetical protein
MAMLIGWLIFGLLSALVSAAIAKARGQDPLQVGLISLLLLGPLAIPLVLLSEPDPAAKQTRAPESEWKPPRAHIFL